MEEKRIFGEGIVLGKLLMIFMKISLWNCPGKIGKEYQEVMVLFLLYVSHAESIVEN